MVQFKCSRVIHSWVLFIFESDVQSSLFQRKGKCPRALYHQVAGHTGVRVHDREGRCLTEGSGGQNLPQFLETWPVSFLNILKNLGGKQKD